MISGHVGRARARLRRFLSWSVCVLAGCAGSPPPISDGPACQPMETGGAFVVVGDFQETSATERWMGRESNDPERVRLVSAIAAERPAFLVLLGDMVFDGGSEEEWARFDVLLRPVREAGIPILPVAGNHEYWGNDRRALGHIRDRFPELRACRWYCRERGALGLIWLDSNMSAMTRAEWEAQLRWFRARLESFDLSSDIRGILVFLHHPPFTNSTVTGDEEHVQRDIVTPFLAARKTLALFSGHAHAYEHFQVEGRHFFVAGGGGGPRVRLLDAERSRHADLYVGPSPRPFHFLVVEMEGGLDPGGVFGREGGEHGSEDGVRILVKGFEKGESSLHLLEGAQVPFPGSP